METNGQAAVALLLDELVRAAVPDLDGAGAVLALRDLALERRVVERMVLDVHGEVLRARLERHALRYGPAREHAVALEPEVVVEAARGVSLDDEDGLPRARRARGPTRERLRRGLRVAFSPVCLEFCRVLHRFSATFPQECGIRAESVAAPSPIRLGSLTPVKQSLCAEWRESPKSPCSCGVSSASTGPGKSLWMLWIPGLRDAQAKTPMARNFALRSRRSAPPGSSSISDSSASIASASRRAASS